ncbi:hypothetical protein MTO96_028172 [Rhipicephalus appendiculatus]
MVRRPALFGKGFAAYAVDRDPSRGPGLCDGFSADSVIRRYESADTGVKFATTTRNDNSQAVSWEQQTTQPPPSLRSSLKWIPHVASPEQRVKGRTSVLRFYFALACVSLFVVFVVVVGVVCDAGPGVVGIPVVAAVMAAPARAPEKNQRWRPSEAPDAGGRKLKRPKKEPAASPARAPTSSTSARSAPSSRRPSEPVKAAATATSARRNSKV